MPNVKLNLSMDAEAVGVLRRRAEQKKIPMGRYLADLIREDHRRSQDELAIEGYQFLAGDTGEFAEDAWRTGEPVQRS